ncbi:DUF2231 domain-containing protein [Nocardia sp. NBC_01388]|uniref:DUF2231 domain-containing protein n=1 Tax=Nocardia sp. NBC_01388 TaxID=2903596 RepID=UPI00325423D0
MPFFDNERTAWRVFHPPLVHLPIGAIVIATILDTISVVIGDRQSLAGEMFRAATFTLAVGTGGLPFAVVSGLLDRARLTTLGALQSRAVNAHAVVVVAMVPVSIAATVLRFARYHNATHTPAAAFVLTLAILTIALAGGRLGGRIRHGRQEYSAMPVVAGRE